MAAQHFLERGFRHFGFCGFDDIYWSRQRCESFCGHIAKAGFQTNIYKRPKLRVRHTWYREEINLMKWLKGLPKPVGIMACNDDRAQHITSTCIKAKIDVPYEVAVIGVDNDEQVCVTSNPPLSSVALDAEKAGFRASELLDKMMAGKKMLPHKIFVRPIKIVTRQSTDIIAIEDKLVVRALNFINQNTERPLQIHNVAKALRFSRSYLHRKFMKTLKRSVYDEIKRVRINLISRMLLETDLSVSDIAIKLGFNSDSHIARYFEQKMGMTPMKYRKLIGHR
jgi:LacI family transcriptional regulator